VRIGSLLLIAGTALSWPMVSPSLSRSSKTVGWTFKLERTIAPSFGSSGALSKPYDLAVTRDGRIVVLDHDSPGALVFSPDGKFDRTIGGRGHGPGEFSAFAALGVRGDTIAVYDDATVLVWRANGESIRQWRTTACNCGGRPVLDGRGNVLTPINVMVAGSRRNALARWSLAGATRDTIILPPLDAAHAWLRLPDGGMTHLPFGAMGVGTFDSKLRYVHGLGVTYTLVFSAHGTDTARVVQLPGERAVIPAKMRDSAYARLTETPAIAKLLKMSDLETRQPMFVGLDTDELDNIWVERPNGRGEIDHFDVVSPGGRLIATVPSPSGQSMPYTPIVFRSGRMYRLSENADGEPVIQVFRVIR
jgi:hypothetical protein